MGLAPTSDAMIAHSPVADYSFGVARQIGDTQIGFSVHTGQNELAQANGTMISAQRGNTKVKLAYIDEKGSLFGTPVGSGAMRLGDGSQTAFIEGSSAFDIGSWAFDAYASANVTRIDMASDTLLTDASDMVGIRFGMIASKAALGGRLSFGIAQPLTVVSGQGTYTLGSGYDLASRSLTFADHKVDFSGKINPRATFGYEAPMSTGALLRFGASSNANGSDVRALASLAKRF